METINIEKVAANEISVLQEIGRITFSETFASSNTSDDMEKYLDESFSFDKISNEVQNKNSLFYFAKYKNQPVGYLKVNFGQSQTEIQDNKSLQIERIYVLNAFQGKKIGQLLFDKAIQIAKKYNVNYIWLGVWEKNSKATKFYTKYGFKAFDQHIFKLGNDEQIDMMMKKQL